MPFPRPSFQDLINSALADLARLPGADVTLRRSLLQVLAYMSAALASGEYDYLDWMVQNVLLPDTATGGYLDRWANIVGLQREGATAAAGNVVFSGTATIPIPAGTQVQSSNQAVILQTTAAAVIGGTSIVTVPVIAIVGGSDGNLLPSSPVTLLAAIAGVVGTANVDGLGLSGGTDAELDSSLRVRLLQRLSSPPQGGAAYDYVTWAEQVTGVTRVWVYPLLYGSGTVGIAFVIDGRANIFPLAADISAVETSIVASAPVTAMPTSFAPTNSPLAITINNLTILSGYTVAIVEANIQTALASLFATVTPGGYGWDGNARAFVSGGQLDLSEIFGAIDNAAGVDTFDLITPTANQAAGFGVMFSLGPVTF